ncbi:MAG: hypothetical protein LBP87_12925, partial [Planctomycetaceae bacterium]|nr:hypothetical protein [Planctomycetaceae bacterium]
MRLILTFLLTFFVLAFSVQAQQIESSADRVNVDLLSEFKKAELKDVKKIVFTTRTQTSEHWYANIGYYAHN